MLKNGRVATRLPAQDLERAKASMPRSSASSRPRSGRAVCATSVRRASSPSSSRPGRRLATTRRWAGRSTTSR